MGSFVPVSGSSRTTRKLPLTHGGAVIPLLVVLLLGMIQIVEKTPQVEGAVSILDLTQISDGAENEATRAAYQAGFYAFSTSVLPLPAVPQQVTFYKPTATTAADAINEAQSGTVACIGPVGDSNVLNALAAAKEKGFVLFGAMVGDTANAGWNPNILLTRMSPATELTILLKCAIVKVHVKTIGFAYTTGVNCGEGNYETAVQYLKAIGSTSSLDVYAVADSAGFSSSAFSTFADGNPGVTLVQGRPSSHMATFVKSLLTDAKMSGSYVLGGSYQKGFMMDVLKANSDSFTGQMYFATSNQQVFSTTSAMTTFLSAMTSAKGNYVNGDVMFQGYVSAYSIAYAVQTFSTAVTFLSGVFTGFTSFLYKDFVLGFYGGEISKVLQEQGEVTTCNQGGQTSYLVKATPDTTALTETFPNYMPICGIQGTIPFATRALCLKYADNTTLSSVATLGCTQASDPEPPLVVGPLNQADSTHALICSTTPAENYETFAAQWRTEVVFGPFDPEKTTLSPTTILWNPIYSTPRINMYEEREYHLTPTFAQDIIMLYATLKANPSGLPTTSNVITGIVQNAPTREMTFYMQEGIVTLANLFGGFPTVYVENPYYNWPIDLYMWYEGYNILIGLESTSLALVADFMKRTENVNCAVYIPYRTLSLIFSEAKSILSSLKTRLLTDSNIPYWSSSSKNPITAELTTAVNVIRMNPYNFVGGTVTPSYTLPLVPHGALTADSVTFGPFYSKGTKNPLTGKESPKKRNWGAAITYMVTGSTAFDNTGTPLYTFTPNEFLYTTLPYVPDSTTTTTTTSSSSSSSTSASPSSSSSPPVSTHSPEPTTTGPPRPTTTKKPLNKQKLAAFILWILVALALWALLALLIFTLCLLCCVAGAAPTNEKKPITMIFTDVDFSAALWSEMPELQELAAAEHERIIRDLIGIHKCYEVNSDGSRFIIAAKKPFKAVELAAEIQTALFQNEWTTQKFDDWYRLMEEKLHVGSYTNYTPKLSLDEYKTLWRGLRVRVGVHTGLCGIHYQSSIRKYRYYGRTVQTAFHIEEMGQGGQSLISEATWDLLSPSEISSIDHTFLGPQTVRGEDHPISLYLLNAVPGRVFGPLRTPPEYIEEEAQKNGKLEEVAQLHAAALRRCYSNFPADERIEELLPVARVWGVLITRQADMNDEEYANHLIDLIAEKLAEEGNNGRGMDDDVDTFDNPTIYINDGVDASTFDDGTIAANDGSTYYNTNDDAFTNNTVEVF